VKAKAFNYRHPKCTWFHSVLGQFSPVSIFQIHCNIILSTYTNIFEWYLPISLLNPVFLTMCTAMGFLFLSRVRGLDHFTLYLNTLTSIRGEHKLLETILCNYLNFSVTSCSLLDKRNLLSLIVDRRWYLIDPISPMNEVQFRTCLQDLSLSLVNVMIYVDKLPHMSSWHSAKLIKHRYNFTLYPIHLYMKSQHSPILCQFWEGRYCSKISDVI
jgi:hypothetical protein